MASGKHTIQSALLRRMADEQALAHRGLRTNFERIEQALAQGDLRRGAELLDELIEQARDHFIHGESLARRAGVPPGQMRRMHHDAMLERARLLKARCLNPPANTELAHGIEAQVVGFLSDLVEDELHTVRQLQGLECAND